MGTKTRTGNSTSPQDIPAMECHGHLDGKSHCATVSSWAHFIHDVAVSAEVIAQMIHAESSDKEWKVPDWLPQRYLTWNRRVE
ncbi:hypothetical protein BDR04DRAFT_1086668 [Suillus decipiens]|nr:hypothetical protein BDR04DRAFT_1086668 [Suillus decipiens]